MPGPYGAIQVFAMQLEQQETFTIHGPQLEVLGEVESKLPAPAKKRSTASVVLVALALVSVFGIGGAKLKGKYNDTAKFYTAIDKYNTSIQTDFGTQVDAAANLIKQVGYLENAPTEALQDARVALEVWNNTAADPAAQYNANRDLYNAVDALYAAVNNKVDASTQQAINNQYNAFVSAQATIERAAAAYNQSVESYETTTAQFPANVISGLWGVREISQFAPQ